MHRSPLHSAKRRPCHKSSDLPPHFLPLRQPPQQCARPAFRLRRNAEKGAASPRPRGTPQAFRLRRALHTQTKAPTSQGTPLLARRALRLSISPFSPPSPRNAAPVTKVQTSHCAFSHFGNPRSSAHALRFGFAETQKKARLRRARAERRRRSAYGVRFTRRQSPLLSPLLEQPTQAQQI